MLCVAIRPRPSAAAIAISVVLLVVCGLTWWGAAGSEQLIDGQLIGGPVPLLLAVACCGGLGALTRLYFSAPVVAAAALLLTAANQTAQPGSYSPANDLYFFGVVLGVPALAATLWQTRRRSIAELRRVSTIRHAQRADAVQAARLEEQNRIAERVELEIGQAMSAIALQASASSRPHDNDGADVQRALAGIESSARDALDLLRREVGVLRESDRIDPAAETVAIDLPARPSPLDFWSALAAVPVLVEALWAGPAAAGAMLGSAGAAIVLAATLAVRRRRPLVAVAGFGIAALLLSVAGVVVVEMVSVILPIVLVAHATGAHARSRLRAGVGLGALMIVLAVLLFAAVGATDSAGPAPTVLLVLCAFLAGVGAHGQRARQRRLEEVIAQIEADRPVAVRLAAARQRQSVARDLHDSVAASMTVVCLHASAARLLPPGDGDVARVLQTIGEAARSGLIEVRAALETARTTSARDPVLTDVLASARGAGVAVNVQSDDLSTVPSAVQGLVARVVREGLVNAARHAAGAQVSVRLMIRDERLVAEIADSGTSGSTPSPIRGTGQGLSALAERVAEAGGDLRWGPDQPVGFRVVVTVPITALVTQ